jgi:hypothetical protein
MKRQIPLLRDCHGSITVVTMIMMFVIVGLLAFVIDMAHVEVVKNEIQNAGDACALRGARAFLPDNLPTGYSQEAPDPNNAKLQAQNAISDNKSDNTAFQTGDLPIGDMQVGIWDYIGEISGSRQLMAWQWPPPGEMWGKYIGPGIRVPTKRTSSTTLGPVAMTLAKIFGIKSVGVNAKATAALSGLGEVKEGMVDLPIYIEQSFFMGAGNPIGKQVTINLNPNTTESGGWFSIPGDTNGNATNPQVLEQYIKGTLQFPAMDVYPDTPTATDVLTNRGEIAGVFDQYESCDPPKNHIGVLYWKWWSTVNCSNKDWIVHLPIIADLGSANDSKQVIGFSTWKVVSVGPPPAKNLVVQLVGGSVDYNGKGGGVYGGILSPEPKLVE